jgi:hypothetical protein
MTNAMKALSDQSLEYRTPAGLYGTSIMAMAATALRNAALLDSGTPSPNPWDLSLSGQNVWSKLEGTRTEDRAPQRCDPSADSRAGMAGAAPMPGPSQSQLRPRRKQSLLKEELVLTEGVRFR